MKQLDVMDVPPPPHPQGVPGIMGRDFVGCSHEAMLEWLRCNRLSPDLIFRHLVAVVEEFGLTHNQRRLLEEVLDRAEADALATWVAEHRETA